MFQLVKRGLKLRALAARISFSEGVPFANVIWVSVALSGKMFQFNITLVVFVSLILGVLLVCGKSSDPLIAYAGVGIALLGFLAVIALVICFYFKQKPRPLDGQAVAITIKEGGREISVRNPPDCLFEKDELNTLARLFLVGYDDNLCPDGEVVGNASERNYRLYSEEEKKHFVKVHKEQIEGKKAWAAKLLAQSEGVEGSKGPQTSDPGTTPQS